MKTTATFLTVLLFASFSLVLAGCGGKGGKNVVPVIGTLKVGGTPAANIQVNFYPVGEGLEIASGKTNDEGKFELFTGNQSGAMVGKYKVVLAKVAGGAMDASYMAPPDQAASDGGSAAPEQAGGFAEKYKTPATTDKEVDITGKTTDLVIEVDAG